MAKSLGQLLKSGSGQLTESTDNTLNEALNQTNRPTAPLSPLAAAQIGTSADAAKMVGTKAQKTPALRQAVEGQDDLATFQRQEQVKTTDQSAKTGKAKQLQTALSGMETRVDQIAAAKMTAAGTTGVDLIDTTKAPKDGPIAAALTALNAALQTPGPEDDVAAVAQYNMAAGLNKVGAIPATKESILSQYGANLGTQLTNKMSNALSNTTVNSIWDDPTQVTALGLPSKPDLAKLLNMKEEDLAKLQIPDLMNKVQGLLDTEYSQVQQLEQQANDPFAGAAARAEARKSLRQAGAEGVRSAESDMDKLADDIADDMLIEIGGQQYSIGSALSNTAITDFITNYLAATPEEKAKLDAEEPSLTTFVKNNEKVLQDSVKALEAAQTTYQGNVDAQNKQYDLGVGNTLGITELANFFPGIDTVGADVSGMLQSSPFFVTLLKPDTSEAERAHLTTYMKNIAALPIDNPLRQDILKTPVEKLRERGLTQPGPQWDDFLKEISISNKLKKIPKYGGTPNDLAIAFGFSSAEALQEMIKEAALMEKSGLFGKTDNGLKQLRQFFEIDKNGNIDYKKSFNKIKDTWLSSTKNVGQFNDITSPSDILKSLGTYVDKHHEKTGPGSKFSIKNLVTGHKSITPRQFAENISATVNLNNLDNYIGAFKDASTSTGRMLAEDLATEAFTRHKFPGTEEKDVTLSSLLFKIEEVNPSQPLSSEQLQALPSIIQNLKDASRSARAKGAGATEKELDNIWRRLEKRITSSTTTSSKNEREANLKQTLAGPVSEISWGRYKDSSPFVVKQITDKIVKDTADNYNMAADIDKTYKDLQSGNIPPSVILDNNAVKKVYEPFVKLLDDYIRQAEVNGAHNIVAALRTKQQKVNELIQLAHTETTRLKEQAEQEKIKAKEIEQQQNNDPYEIDRQRLLYLENLSSEEKSADERMEEMDLKLKFKVRNRFPGTGEPTGVKQYTNDDEDISPIGDTNVVLTQDRSRVQ